jgi:deoxyribodipyrimidine photolyase-like uncharacterized protein
MGISTYTRKTDNPNMGWSEARKAEWSVQCKKRHAEGNFYKKSKKDIGILISNGKKEAVKFKNRSNGQRKRHANLSENLLDKAQLPEEVETANIKTDLIGDRIGRVFDFLEKNFGVRPNYKEFIISAVEEKLEKIKEEYNGTL